LLEALFRSVVVKPPNISSISRLKSTITMVSSDSPIPKEVG
jgi:hypothetical protein